MHIPQTLPLLIVLVVLVVRVALRIESGISTVDSIASSSLQLGDGRAKDMKFIDDDKLLVLWDSAGNIEVQSTKRIDF